MQPFRLPATEPHGNAFSCSSKTPFAQRILITTYGRRNTAPPEKLPLKHYISSLGTSYGGGSHSGGGFLNLNGQGSLSSCLSVRSIPVFELYAKQVLLLEFPFCAFHKPVSRI